MGYEQNILYTRGFGTIFVSFTYERAHTHIRKSIYLPIFTIPLYSILFLFLIAL